VKVLCSVMEVSRSGYYSYLKDTQKPEQIEEKRLIAEVKMLDKQSKESYGSRRMSKALKAKGYCVGRYQARSLMRKAGVKCKQRKRYKVTTQSNHRYPIASNVLNREFTVKTANEVWVADITYLWTQEGWLYLAAVLDVYSRRIVGWSMADHMKEQLVENALIMAIKRRQPVKGLLHHSDQGCQYASDKYQHLLNQNGIRVSMSRKGNCWDNSVMERFFGSLKTERTDGKNYVTREQARMDIIDYIEMFYNSQRLHSTLNYVSPMQFEVNNQISRKKVSIFT
jgi:putative transposase